MHYFFSCQNTNWVLVVPEYRQDNDLNTYLKKSGFFHEVEGVAMYLDLAMDCIKNWDFKSCSKTIICSIMNHCRNSDKGQSY